MKRSLTSSLLVFLLTALVGTALNARAEAKTDQPVDAHATAVYWAS